MGYEYAAELPAGLAAVGEALLDVVAGDRRWQVAYRRPGALGLAWVGWAGAAGWPAAAELSVEPTRLVLVIHAGTGAERAALVAVLRGALEVHAEGCVLTEL